MVPVYSKFIGSALSVNIRVIEDEMRVSRSVIQYV